MALSCRILLTMDGFGDFGSSAHCILIRADSLANANNAPVQASHTMKNDQRVPLFSSFLGRQAASGEIGIRGAAISRSAAASPATGRLESQPAWVSGRRSGAWGKWFHYWRLLLLAASIWMCERPSQAQVPKSTLAATTLPTHLKFLAPFFPP